MLFEGVAQRSHVLGGVVGAWPHASERPLEALHRLVKIRDQRGGRSGVTERFDLVDGAIPHPGEDAPDAVLGSDL